MSWLLACVLLPACSGPTEEVDPDALLRAGQLSEALAAWEIVGGEAVDAHQPAVQALSRRAPSERWITTAVLVEFGLAGTLLDAQPGLGLQALDLSFSSWTPMADCVAGRLAPPWRVVVARSDVPADGDPSVHGRPWENIPYRGGRIVGTVGEPVPGPSPTGADAAAPTAVARVSELFARIDQNPPTRRLTLLLADARGRLSLHFERRDGLWWTLSATDAEAGAALILACGG